MDQGPSRRVAGDRRVARPRALMARRSPFARSEHGDATGTTTGRTVIAWGVHPGTASDPAGSGQDATARSRGLGAAWSHRDGPRDSGPPVPRIARLTSLLAPMFACRMDVGVEGEAVLGPNGACRRSGHGRSRRGTPQPSPHQALRACLGCRAQGPGPRCPAEATGIRQPPRLEDSPHLMAAGN